MPAGRADRKVEAPARDVVSVLTLQFWREEHVLKRPEHGGAVFVVKIQAAEFVGILDDLVAILDRG